MITKEIENTILLALPDATAYIVDPQNDGQHFEAIVISPSFEGLMLIKQHQLVMKPLKEKFETSVHALSLKTFTPSKWESEKDNYNIHKFQ
jgi:acid stress-induced BolA-like protein IbaG/YrbA